MHHISIKAPILNVSFTVICGDNHSSHKLPFDDFLEIAETITTTTTTTRITINKLREKQWRLKTKIASINEATNDRQILIKMLGSNTLSIVGVKPFPAFFPPNSLVLVFKDIKYGALLQRINLALRHSRRLEVLCGEYLLRHYPQIYVCTFPSQSP